MTGPAEIFFTFLWKLLPQRSRERLSLLLLSAQSRTSIHVPASKARVVARSDELRKRFPAATPPGKAAPPRYSLLCTVYNEGAAITAWLDSVSSQQHLPSELIIVDGGSQDDTVLRVREWEQGRTDSARSFTLTLVEGKRLNIAEGRNRAAAAAQEEILAFTDAGCELDRFWAERILQPFADDPALAVSMGWYRPVSPGKFHTALNRFLLPQLESLDPDSFLPSARSIAVRRDTYHQLCGYPEYLTFAGEDSLFDYYLKCEVPAAAFVPDALVYWKPPAHLPKLFGTVKNYARGDAEGGRLAWLYYLNLLRVFGKLALETAVLVFFALLFDLTEFRVFVILEWLVAAAMVLRYLALVLGYGPFREAGIFSAAGWRSFFAVQFLVWAQAIGFCQGLLARKGVERRRREKATAGKLVVLSSQALVRGDASADAAVIRKLLRERNFVTHIFAAYPKTSDTPLYQHQFLDPYLRSAFHLEQWEGASNPAELRILDLVNDSLSRPLCELLERGGAKRIFV